GYISGARGVTPARAAACRFPGSVCYDRRRERILFPHSEDHSMATAQLAVPQRLLLSNVNWQSYEDLLEKLEERHIRLSYDRGELEIMTLTHEHEHYGSLLGRLIEALTEELNVPIHSGGSTTFKRKSKRRGLEPDKCYWIQNEPSMRGKKTFDVKTDPPPDLAVDVDISSSSLKRMAIYAALGVPEIWRFDGEVFEFYQ